MEAGNFGLARELLDKLDAEGPETYANLIRLIPHNSVFTPPEFDFRQLVKNRYPLHKCDRCGEMHRKKNKRFCSRRCGKLVYDSGNQKQRREKELSSKLNRARQAQSEWEATADTSIAWKPYVAQCTGLSAKFLTRHFNLGNLKEPPAASLATHHRAPKLSEAA